MPGDGYTGEEELVMKDIPGYEGLYAADENGVIWSLITNTGRRAGPLKPYPNTGGYMRVNLFKAGHMSHQYVHRLVAKTFLPNPNGYEYVNHKDADRTNNAVSNLEWCTAKYNIAYSRSLGNQSKDKVVKAYSVLTGEMLSFQNIKGAAVFLFDKDYALDYCRKKHGDKFAKGEWVFEIG